MTYRARCAGRKSQQRQKMAPKNRSENRAGFTEAEGRYVLAYYNAWWRKSIERSCTIDSRQCPPSET